MSGVETAFVCLDVQGERAAQDAQWGQQNHPDVPFGSEGNAEYSARLLAMPTAPVARNLCDITHRSGTGTWAHIAVEELAEAIEAAALGNTDNLRTELVQLAAVAVAWVEAIDRRNA